MHPFFIFFKHGCHFEFYWSKLILTHLYIYGGHFLIQNGSHMPEQKWQQLNSGFVGYEVSIKQTYTTPYSTENNKDLFYTHRSLIII